MSQPPSTLRNSDGSTVGNEERRHAAEVGRRVTERWELTGAADLPAALAADPGILADRSVFFDLAQKEFRLHRDEWTNRPAGEYCQRFQELDDNLLRSLRRLIEVEQCLGDVALDQLLDVTAEVEWPVAGQLFGKFYVSHELGRGSAGRVFLCRQSSLGDREVVVKVSRAVNAEASTLGKLSHPNVVPVHDAGDEPRSGLGWICMPSLGSRTLQDAIVGAFVAGSPKTNLLGAALPSARPIRGRELHEAAVLRLFAELADGLSYVHQQGMLHGDLKPSNVLLTDEGVPMLIDFNLARGVAADATMLGGTLPYMAPEQLGAVADGPNANSLSPATDVFAFGVTLHHALTGNLPFESCGADKRLGEIALSLLDSQAAWRTEGGTTLAEIDAPIARLVQSCLAESPADRPHGFDTLRDALQRLHSPALRCWRFAARRPNSSTTAAAVGLVIAAGMAWAMPLTYEAGVLRAAHQLSAAERHTESVELLTTYVADYPDDIEAHRLLANSLLDSGDPREAISHFMQAWRSDGQPLDVAMAGYCQNRIGHHEAAIPAYEQVRERGLVSGVVLHNQAASLLTSLAKTFDTEVSHRIDQLLIQAWNLDPNNETIRLTMLRHHRTVLERDAPRPAYPIEIAAFPNANSSYEFCREAARFVAFRSSTVGELRQYGVPCLRRMAGLREVESMAHDLGDTLMSTYGPLLGESPLDQGRLPKPPKPPEFIDPRVG